MGTFSRIFGSGDKELQKKADELLLDISKAFQSASAKMCVAANEWQNENYDKIDELKEEIIELEREADQKKERIVEDILTKHAYLPQQTRERHKLVNLMDAIVDASEDAIRIMAVGKGIKPPREIAQIAKKCWVCTDYLQDALKYLFKDFDKSVEYTHKVDSVREEARDTAFELLDYLYQRARHDTKELMFFQTVAERILEVAINAEITGDFIRELAVRYS
ncbi:DUF47 family protein [Candidatus Thorarchaeota archaeon]|nr:MAG: DUF47 family protein [Candidatus Thorarchaeota archaeon]